MLHPIHFGVTWNGEYLRMFEFGCQFFWKKLDVTPALISSKLILGGSILGANTQFLFAGIMIWKVRQGDWKKIDL